MEEPRRTDSELHHQERCAHNVDSALCNIKNPGTDIKPPHEHVFTHNCNNSTITQWPNAKTDFFLICLVDGMAWRDR